MQKRPIYPCAGYIGHPFAIFVVFRERMSHVASTGKALDASVAGFLAE